jgi:hypothetical protein
MLPLLILRVACRVGAVEWNRRRLAEETLALCQIFGWSLLTQQATSNKQQEAISMRYRIQTTVIHTILGNIVWQRIIVTDQIHRYRGLEDIARQWSIEDDGGCHILQHASMEQQQQQEQQQESKECNESDKAIQSLSMSSRFGVTVHVTAPSFHLLSQLLTCPLIVARHRRCHQSNAFVSCMDVPCGVGPCRRVMRGNRRDRRRV